MTDVDLSSYGEPNDIGPDDPAPRAPEGQPDEFLDEYKLWAFEAEASETVPDLYIVDRHPEPLDFRMWVFVGRTNESHFVMRASHKYGPDETIAGGREDCCEVLFEEASLTEQHCPDAVVDLVAERTGVSVVMPGRSENDHGGPINY